MKTTIRFILFSLLILITACTKTKTIEADYEVIPLPQQIVPGTKENFTLDHKTQITYPQGNDTLKRTAEFLADYLNDLIGIKPVITDKVVDKNAIVLKKDFKHGETSEAYNLIVNKDRILVNGSGYPGVFYGVQTIRKSIPLNTDATIVFPAVEITDYPRFGYRGMHLDVVRHFFSIDVVKRYIDIIALHNINRFHWHLTDNQGWRIEIKKYPQLIEIGSHRAQTMVGKTWVTYDGIPHGGYFTQEQIKDVVAYAQERFITIIPEVDVPGHTVAALASLPYLGCTGGPYKVRETWGVAEDVLCAGNEQVYTFMEDVFTEVLELFPSEYIHIGGDECPKVRWEACPKCQAKIKELGLKADANHTKEERLQSYLVQRLEKFLNSKGRRIIGWDEILEGGIAPDATIMSWRGVDGGIAAAKQHHDAIMTPVNHAYFDYYQTYDTRDEPLSFGGYVPIEKVYNFEPVSDKLDEHERKYIIGLQGNMWAEYIPDEADIQYKLLPRLGAISEVQWTMPEKKNFEKYIVRQGKLVHLYSKMNYIYSPRIFDIKADIQSDYAAKVIKVALSTFDNAAIYYTLDNSEPTEKSTRYTVPVEVKADAELKAVAVRGNEKGKTFSKQFCVNKATFKNVEFLTKPTPRHTYKGTANVTDGVKTYLTFPSGEWVGFSDEDCVMLVDLEQDTEISSVVVGNCISTDDWVFGPRAYEIEVSQDNKTFKKVFEESFDPASETNGMKFRDYTATFPVENTRYVKVTLKTQKPEDWNDGKKRTGYGFVFVDEIIMN